MFGASDGARRGLEKGARAHGALLPLVVVLAALGGAGCAHRDEPVPEALLDGSPVREAPIALEGVEGETVLTRATVVSSREIDSRSASCLARGWRLRPAPTSVERIGATSASVTFRDAAGQAVFGCDTTAPVRDGSPPPWCGTTYGRLFGGRLRDPRLDLLCRSSRGAPVALAWIEPHPSTTFLAVRQPGYVEVYEVVGGLPVRVSSLTGIDAERSRAEFDLSEHDRGGRLIVRRKLEAAVAG